MGDRTWTKIQYPHWADILLAKGDYNDPMNVHHKVDLHNLWRYFGPDRKTVAEGEDLCVEESYTESTESEADGGAHYLCEILRQLNVPFDTDWASGGDFSEGTEVYRFNEKEQKMWSYISGPDASDAEMSRLMGLVSDGRNPEACFDSIVTFMQNTGFDITPIEDLEDYDIPEETFNMLGELLADSWEAHDKVVAKYKRKAAIEPDKDEDDVVRVDVAISKEGIYEELKYMAKVVPDIDGDDTPAKILRRLKNLALKAGAITG